jgi:hypothetical protein
MRSCCAAALLPAIAFFFPCLARIQCLLAESKWKEAASSASKDK